MNEKEQEAKTLTGCFLLFLGIAGEPKIQYSNKRVKIGKKKIIAKFTILNEKHCKF